MTCRHPNRPAPRRGRDAAGDLWCLQIMALPRRRRWDIAARGGAVRPRRTGANPVGPARESHVSVLANAEGPARRVGLADQIRAAQAGPPSGRGGARRDRRTVQHLRDRSGRTPEFSARDAERKQGNTIGTLRVFLKTAECCAEYPIAGVNRDAHRHHAIRMGPGQPHTLSPGPLRRQRGATAEAKGEAKGHPRPVPVPAEIALSLAQHVALGDRAVPVVIRQAERKCRLQRICRPQVGPEQDANLVFARAQSRPIRPEPATGIGRRRPRVTVQRDPGHRIRPVHRNIGGGAVMVWPSCCHPVARRHPAQAVFAAPPAGVGDHPGLGPGTDRAPRAEGRGCSVCRFRPEAAKGRKDRSSSNPSFGCVIKERCRRHVHRQMNLRARIQLRLHRQAHGNRPMVHPRPYPTVRAGRRIGPRHGGQAAPRVRVVAQAPVFGPQPRDGPGPVRNGPAFVPCRIRDVRTAAEGTATVEGGPRKVHRQNTGEPGGAQVRRGVMDHARRVRLPDDPAAHRRNPVGNRQRLDRVMGHMDPGIVQPAVHPPGFHPPP